MSERNKPKVAFIFNPRGVEGYYIFSEGKEERDIAMRLVSFLSGPLDILAKKAAEAIGGQNVEAKTG